MTSTEFQNHLPTQNKIPNTVYPGSPLAIHFIGLGGIGMSGLAQLLLEMGYKVTGSDIKDSPVIYAMTNYGAITFIGHHFNNIEGAGVIVVSSAIKNDNPEFCKAKELGIPIMHRAELLSALMNNAPENRSTSIGVTGTHGKTTTTGMTSLIFEDADLMPTIVVGGIMPHLNSNSRLGSGQCFIAELDESDGTIALYSPHTTVITNLELDHVDFYKKGVEDLIQTFRSYVKKLPDTAQLVVNIDCDGVRRVLDATGSKKIITYSLKDKNADYYAGNLCFNGTTTVVDIYYQQAMIGSLALKVHGKHNVYNALASTATALNQNINFSVIQSALAQFTGMKRRFQFISQVHGADIIDDYAHHPTEISATILTARDIVMHKKTGKVKVVFQPHRYSRVETFWNDFKNAFDGADYVYITDVYGAGESPIEGIHSKKLVEEMNNSSIAYISGNLENIASVILPEIEQNDLIITMGAGDITKLGHILTTMANGV